MASPQTVFSLASDGYCSGQSATYATARTNVYDVGSTTTTSLPVGQQWTGTVFNCFELMFNFDTGAVIPDTATVTVATPSFYATNDQSTTDFVMELRTWDWGDTLSGGGDWVSGADLAGKTLLASKTTAGMVTNDYTAFTSEAALLAAVSLTGFTRTVLSSSRHRVGNEPAGNEFTYIYMADQSGTTYDPKIYVEYTEAASGNPWNYYAQL